MDAPLQGLKVLDFTQNLPGPYATLMLASLGAEVVKVEPPKGDPGRWAKPLFAQLNRGKRSVVLDLRDEASRPAVEALLGWADVLVEGFRPGVMDRLGVGWEAAQAVNERLIYCSISAFGQQGPRRDEPGHDLNLQALAGVCHLERDARDRPRGTALPVADLSAAMAATTSICAALAARGPDRPGRYLDVAMSDAVLSWSVLWSTGVDLAAPVRSSPVPEPLTRSLVDRLDRERLFALPHYGLFRCRDGRWLALGIVDERHFWEALCGAVGLRAFARVSLPARILGGSALRGMLRAVFRTRDRATWLERLQDAGVPATPVLAPREAIDDAQVRARGLVRGGDVRVPLPGARIPAEDAPKLGEHTGAVLGALGISLPPEGD